MDPNTGRLRALDEDEVKELTPKAKNSDETATKT